VTYRLIIRPEAERDIALGRDWYETKRVGLGAELLSAVEVIFDRITQMPNLYPPEYKSIRRVGMKRFPYVVYYRIIGEVVEVIAVLHASRDTRRWRSRS
jgi:toxin ParE1/3/4